MKVFKRIFAGIAVVGSLFALAGCSSGTPDARVATTANWNVRTSAIVEKDSLEFWKTHKEVATYVIKHEEGTNSTYSVQYDGESTLVTEFYLMESYDWASDKIPSAYRSAESVKEPVYVYKTELKATGFYQLAATGAKKEFSDVITTVCYYRLAGANLQPVYSKQQIKNTAANALSPGSLDDACITVDADYETYYNRDCTEATTVTVDRADSTNSGEKSYSITSKEGYSVFENCQLRAALRALTLTGGATRVFNLVVPQSGIVQTCGAAVSEPLELMNDSDHPEQQAITQAVKDSGAYIFFDGTPSGDEGERKMRYNAVTLSIKASLAGQNPVCWFATVENNDVNSTRAVLLRMVTPLSFGMGTLAYNLSKLELTDIAE